MNDPADSPTTAGVGAHFATSNRMAPGALPGVSNAARVHAGALRREAATSKKVKLNDCNDAAADGINTDTDTVIVTDTDHQSMTAMQTNTTGHPHPPRLPMQHVRAEPFDFRFNQAPNERLFTALCDAYAATGGMAWGDDLAERMADRRPALSAPSLARLIASGAIIYVDWRGSKWIPMAQFHLHDLSIHNAIRQVRRELGGCRDGWEAASWFVCPNEWLNGRRPLDLVDGDLDAVVQAARADRFLAGG